MMTCSAPPDCAEIERRRATGIGLLVDGGASRGNLLSGEAEDVILTVSRMEAEKKSNPGYRAFFANGDNATRTLVLFGWEVILEWTAALRAIRRDVQPRGHRGGIYPLMRGALCVFVRDLIVSGVLTDIMRGRPAVYATFSSYDEVAHHSGPRARRHARGAAQARRPVRRTSSGPAATRRGRTRSSSSPTTGRRRARPSSSATATASTSSSSARSRSGDVQGIAGGDEQSSMVGNAVSEATGKQAEAGQERRLRPRRRRARLGQPRARLPDGGAPPADARGDRRAAPGAAPRAPQRTRTSAGCSSAPRSTARSRSAPTAPTTSPQGRVEGEDPLAHFSPHAPQHLLRTDGFEHVGDIMVGSFYDPELDEGCAFEELISLPRRHRRPPDPAVHPPPDAPRGARGARSSAPPACTASSRAGGSSSRGTRRAQAETVQPQAETSVAEQPVGSPG